jgi:polyhydroxyalkanoate synthesis regulator phasin
MSTVKSNISSLNILQKNFAFLAYTLQNYINENITKENFYNTYMKNLNTNIDELKKKIIDLEEEL